MRRAIPEDEYDDSENEDLKTFAESFNAAFGAADLLASATFKNGTLQIIINGVTAQFDRNGRLLGGNATARESCQ
jgi:hypothetical protein